MPKTFANPLDGSSNCAGVTFKNAPMVLFIIINPTKAAMAATPSPPASPIATPSAKMIGKLSKIIPPAPVIMLAIF